MKRCARCKVPFKRRRAESNYAFERRVYCSQKCDATARSEVLDEQRRNAAEFAWAVAKAHFGLGGR